MTNTKPKASTRYAVALGALLPMAVLPFATAFRLAADLPRPAQPAVEASPVAAPSALTGLTPRQLEAILAHELAHVRRHDYRRRRRPPGRDLGRAPVAGGADLHAGAGQTRPVG